MPARKKQICYFVFYASFDWLAKEALPISEARQPAVRRLYELIISDWLSHFHAPYSRR